MLAPGLIALAFSFPRGLPWQLPDEPVHLPSGLSSHSDLWAPSSGVAWISGPSFPSHPWSGQDECGRLRGLR